LPLLPKNEYYKQSSEVAFSFKDVWASVQQLPPYITWDNVIDIFLTKHLTTSIISNSQQAPISSEDYYGSAQTNKQSIAGSVKIEEGEVADSVKDFKNDYVLSFSDSVIKPQNR